MEIASLIIFRIATIADGETQSDTLDVRGYDVIGVQKGADATGTSITFKGNVDGTGTLYDVKDPSGNSAALTVANTTAQLSVFYQDKELRGLNQLALVTNSAPGADVKYTVGLRYAAG